jgi:hypothetical protein
MAHNSLPVQGHLGRGVDTGKFQVYHLVLPVKFRAGKGFFVGAGTTEIIIAAVLPVQRIPGMGNIHPGNGPFRTGKGPIVIQKLQHSHKRVSPCGFSNL